MFKNVRKKKSVEKQNIVVKTANVKQLFNISILNSVWFRLKTPFTSNFKKFIMKYLLS